MTEIPLAFRSASAEDLPRLITLLKDDAVAHTRESATPDDDSMYVNAFNAIAADPNNDLVIVERDGAVVGFLQMTLIPGLGRKGATRLQIESIRVSAGHRNQGIGAALIGHAINLGRRRGAVLAQLTTDKRRGDAHRLYERLGFEASHEGYKMPL